MNSFTKNIKIGIIGLGAWGQGIKNVLIDNDNKVMGWDKYIQSDSSLENILSDSKILIIAIPFQKVRSFFKEISYTDIKNKKIINLSKGIEIGSGKLFSEILQEFYGSEILENYCLLTGPSHSEEVMKKLPTTVTCLSKNIDLAEKCQNLFTNKYFRVYSGTDYLGGEIGGALKNVIAIAAGVCDGLKLGDNARAALITRGLAEMIRFSRNYETDSLTFTGLAGLGDLIVTCNSLHSRNYKCGEFLAENFSIDQIKDKIKQTIEGIYTVEAVYSLSKKKGISMPICESIYDILYKKLLPEKAVEKLMTRLAKPEFY